MISKACNDLNACQIGWVKNYRQIEISILPEKLKMEPILNVLVEPVIGGDHAVKQKSSGVIWSHASELWSMVILMIGKIKSLLFQFKAL